MSYKSWNGGSWCARIYGNTFVHAENCNWAAAHSDSVITYVSGGNGNWAATLSGKTFTHAYQGNFASSHTDTILNYIEPSSGANWTVKIQ
jgi:hypothetical protein